jgi:hypothetical protein
MVILANGNKKPAGGGSMVGWKLVGFPVSAHQPRHRAARIVSRHQVQAGC